MSSSQGVLFLRNVNGKLNWFEDGDEDNDGKYIGEIENGKPNGTGSITFPDGRKYVGEFKDGKKHGQGILTSYLGFKFEGEWKNNKPWNGILYDKDGKISKKTVNGVNQ